MTNSIFHDPPIAAIRAENERLRIESGGSLLFGRVMLPALASCEARTPVVLFLHGCPGTEKNSDIAQLLRMAGIACAGFAFRGVWGSKGYYCFSHLIEDTRAVAEYLRANADRLRIDPDHLYLFGHSMGGFTAINAAAEGLKAKGVFLLAPCDIGGWYLFDRDRVKSLGLATLNGYFTVPDDAYILRDLEQSAERWSFRSAAERLDTSIPYFFIGGTRDTTTPPNANIMPALDILRRRGARTDYLELDDSHGFAGSRFRIAEYVYDGIQNTEKA